MFAAILLACVLFTARAGIAQNYLYSTGAPPFTVAEQVENGFVNLANGNLHLQIPITSSPQRGQIPYSASLVYDSRIWQIFNNGTSQTWQPTNVANSQGGWRGVTTVDPGTVTYSLTSTICGGSQLLQTWQNFVWTQPDGTQRIFPIQTSQNQCTSQNVTSGDAYAEDSTGFHMYVTNYTTATIYSKSGIQVYPSVKDTNGNFFSVDGNGNVIDTLGRTPATKTLNGNVFYADVLNSQGSRSRYTFTTTTINVNTAFGQSGVTEYSGTLTVIQSITFPDNPATSYTFSYDSGTTPGHYGSLTGITLRTGGTVTYAYTNFQDSYGNVNQWVSSRTSGGGTWTFAPHVISTCQPGTVGCQQTVTRTQPSTDAAVYTFTLNNGAWNTQRQFYTGSATTGTLLKTITNDFDYTNACPLACTGNAYIRPIRTTATDPIPGGSVSKKTEYDYDSIFYGNLSDVKEWLYYSGTPAVTPDRETDLTYLTTSSYVSKDIHDHVITKTVKNGLGTQYSQSNLTYDETNTLTSITGIANHDDTNFGMANTTRGNLTTKQDWVSGTTSLSDQLTYDTTGQRLSRTDPMGNKTRYSYADAFYTDNGQNTPPPYTPPVPTNAHLTLTTYPNSQTYKYRYYFNTSQFAWDEDENQTRSYRHYIDPLDRLTEIDGRTVNTGTSRGWKLFVYTSSTQTDTGIGITTTDMGTTCASQSSCRHDRTNLDSFGRVIKTTLVNDPDGQTFVDTVFDSSSRTLSSSNPYRSTQDPTYGLESFQYDGLNRIIASTHADGNVLHTYLGAAVSGAGGATAQLCPSATYGLGYPVLSVDEAGKKGQIWTDGFDRTIETDEPDSTNNLTISTCSTYDPLDNLTGIVQGNQTRSYSYDGLSRVTTSSEPESGITTSYYTTSSSALCSGRSTNLCRVNDARNITATYAYDARNRLISKSFSDTTPAITYFYDQTSYNGLTILNGLGRRTGMSDGSGKTAWSYDPAGHVLTKRKIIGTTTKSIAYTYNLDDSLTTVEYPFTTSNKTVTYSYSNAQRQIAAVDAGLSINYGLNATYSPQGGLASVVHGKVSGSFAGITDTRSYNNRLQLSNIQDSSANGTVQDYSYSYNLGGGVNNGNVASVIDNLTSGRTQTFSYDTLNRLATAQTQATSGSVCWGQSFNYDRYGNYVSASVTQCSAPSPNFSFDGNNHIANSGYTYDAAGNLTRDPNQVSDPIYGYDAENHLTHAAGTNYTYDGNGMRVKKSTNELNWFDESGTLLAETNSSGGDTRHFIYFAGRMIARREYASGNVYYYFGDQLQSARNMTDAQGKLQYSSDFYPYGQENNIFDCSKNSTCSGTDAVGTNHTHRFTSKKRDPESQIDYRPLRMYDPPLGRWLTTDPIPAHLCRPQSLNRYNYVGNNPINFTDPSGGFGVGERDVCAPGGGIDIFSFLQLSGGAFPPLGFSLTPCYTLYTVTEDGPPPLPARNHEGCRYLELLLRSPMTIDCLGEDQRAIAVIQPTSPSRSILGAKLTFDVVKTSASHGIQTSFGAQQSGGMGEGTIWEQQFKTTEGGTIDWYFEGTCDSFPFSLSGTTQIDCKPIQVRRPPRRQPGPRPGGGGRLR
jgi:RHS repeat-associated protein